MDTRATPPVLSATRTGRGLETCSWTGCDRPMRYKKLRLCVAHYQRQNLGRDMGAPFKGSQRDCSHPGCDRPHSAKGWCAAHYQRALRGDDMDAPFGEKKTCTHPGCNRPHNARGYCYVHYHRKYIRPSDMDAPIRRYRRKNEPERECTWGGCEQLWQGAGSGLCPRHELRRKEGRPMDGPQYYRDKPGHYDAAGYWHIPVGGGRSRPEHRVVMEQVLCRPLLREEQVHHKNGVKDDNRPENLELWVSWSGQRVDDLIEFVVVNYRDLLITKLR